MHKIELIYDMDCPNPDKARAQLSRALTELGLPLKWQEWIRTDPDAPDYTKAYGSPTILVNGRDVGGGSALDGAAGCRVYANEHGALQGVPPVTMIKQALAGGRAGKKSGWRRILAAVPAVGAALLPAVGCPACWPAYASLFGSVGVGVFNYSPYLFPFMVVSLMLAVLSLGHRARQRRGYGPLALGAVAAVVILTGKFALDSSMLLYGGIALLLGASVWNAWPRKIAVGGACPACTGNETQAEAVRLDKEGKMP